MPFSEKYNCFFFHIPKTGGTAIEIALDVYCRRECFTGRTVQYEHFSYNDLLKHCWTPPNFENMFKFSIVRNPYDKILSSFFYEYRKINLGDDFQNIKKLFHKEARRRCSVVNDVFNDGDNITDRLRQKRSHYSPQIRYIHDDLDYVGRFEDMDSSWKHICENLEHNIPLQRHNVSEQRKAIPYQEFYTEEIKELVYNTYKEDFEYFGYTF